MKRVLALWIMILLAAMLPFSAAAEVTSVDQIPVTEDAKFPLAVEKELMDKTVIKSSERLTESQIKLVQTSCQQALDSADEPLVTVDTKTTSGIPALQNCAVVQCAEDYVYYTVYDRGVTVEWLAYTDGTVTKKVSMSYEDRTTEFEEYRYTVVNDNNESLKKSRTKTENDIVAVHWSDFLFGMAVATVLFMIIVIVVRKLKK